MKDPRERHIVCKLDRYELEDRYLRLLEELNSLKKLSNCQEDKIKRLATKLMRFGANPRACVASIQYTDFPDKLSILENENSKLREKICLLRNQLGNSKLFKRSPSRGRKPPPVGSSAPITSRSESSRLQAPSCQCMNARPETTEENDVQNYSLKIQEMEGEKKELLCRIAELEAELASYTSGNRREKVAENVEYIRVWRQMKQQSEKLEASQAANEILNEQIHQLRCRLAESCRSCEKISAELDAERKQMSRLDESMSKVKDSQIDLREKDERIMDLTNEMHILQQHNRELLELSSKFGKVEQENAELKRKISEQLSEQQILKDTISKEKANMTALQAANDQLLVKLHELQKNIDVMTIQLMAQNELQKDDATVQSKKVTSSPAPLEDKADLDKKSSKDNSEVCKKCCNDLKTKICQCDKGCQTNENLLYVSETTQTENLSASAKLKDSVPIENYENNKSNVQHPHNGNSLTREGMLKLLEQVQISTPLESQNANRIRNSEASTVSIRVSRPISNLETLLFGDSAL